MCSGECFVAKELPSLSRPGTVESTRFSLLDLHAGLNPTMFPISPLSSCQLHTVVWRRGPARIPANERFHRAVRQVSPPLRAIPPPSGPPREVGRVQESKSWPVTGPADARAPDERLLFLAVHGSFEVILPPPLPVAKAGRAGRTSVSRWRTIGRMASKTPAIALRPRRDRGQPPVGCEGPGGNHHRGEAGCVSFPPTSILGCAETPPVEDPENTSRANARRFRPGTRASSAASSRGCREAQLELEQPLRVVGSMD